MTRRVKLARAAFLRGVGRLVDLGAASDAERRKIIATVSVESALASDWYAVGEDLRAAISRAEQMGMENGRKRSTT